ncbi:MAG TPA: PBP1A family penicillin-binding protein [Terriglobales bacterium]|nr:PBP1A family penicillin-binding protein [Terriglobales bacterium]
MPIKLKFPRSKAARGAGGRSSNPAVKVALAAVILVVCATVGVFAYYYLKYERIVERRMRGPIFANAAKIYATPKLVRTGDHMTAHEIAAQLRRAGYTEGGDSPLGTFKLVKSGIDIRPGPASYHSAEGAVIHVSEGQVDKITGADDKRDELAAYELEPQLVTALSDSEQRAKRRLVSFGEIPKAMVDAVLAIEDRRFFQHAGVNYYRLMEAALVDVRSRRHEQGGSTLTMQIARGFFLSPQKTIKRKLTEMLIAVELEQRFSKQQLFEMYANSVYMGQRGSFTIQGFGEASQAYFGKDIKNLTLPEAALLAGMIQRPNYLSPYKYPERVLERRNLVLDSMVETGAITREQADKAKATPLKLAPPNVEASDAPYFVDLVKDILAPKFPERDMNEHGYRIYTTLDPQLQEAAAVAVQVGVKLIDAKVEKLRTKRQKVGTGNTAKWETAVQPGPVAQVALVAMDPHSGNVLALVGGRNYGFSQLNHAVARRPTGSVFKPFVYAAAINTGLDGTPVLTPASVVDDSPTTFAYGDQIYEPRNYKEEYHGPVSATYALSHSLNNATVKVAEMTGYDKVAALARAAGIKSVQATPAIALGAYDATPLDMASAYTLFANSGVKVSPLLVTSVRDAQGEVIKDFAAEKQPALDPRVAYIMTSMMETVLNSGTAAGVRARGFTAPAAGKTGTSHDGWFAGYTSNLLCIVWVGFDDYSDLRLSGADTAAPIWAEFMKKAGTFPEYQGVKPFTQPAGVVDVKLDKVTNRLATPTCPDDYIAAFLAGTEPTDTCDHAASTQQQGFFSRILGLEPKPSPPPAVSNTGQQQAGQIPGQQTSAQSGPAPKKKKGFFGKIVGVFKGDDSNKSAADPADNSGQTRR